MFPSTVLARDAVPRTGTRAHVTAAFRAEPVSVLGVGATGGGVDALRGDGDGGGVLERGFGSGVGSREFGALVDLEAQYVLRAWVAWGIGELGARGGGGLVSSSGGGSCGGGAFCVGDKGGRVAWSGRAGFAACGGDGGVKVVVGDDFAPALVCGPAGGADPREAGGSEPWRRESAVGEVATVWLAVAVATRGAAWSEEGVLAAARLGACAMGYGFKGWSGT